MTLCIKGIQLFSKPEVIPCTSQLSFYQSPLAHPSIQHYHLLMRAFQELSSIHPLAIALGDAFQTT